MKSERRSNLDSRLKKKAPFVHYHRITGETPVPPEKLNCLCEWLNSFIPEANEAISPYRLQRKQ